MHQANGEANGRAPPPECCAFAWIKRHDRPDSNAAQQVDAGDNAQSWAHEWKLGNSPCTGECVKRPSNEGGRDD